MVDEGGGGDGMVDGEAGCEVEWRLGVSQRVNEVKGLTPFYYKGKFGLGVGLLAFGLDQALILDLELDFGYDINMVRLVCKVLKPKDLFCNF